jgi:hypothetical protein
MTFSYNPHPGTVKEAANRGGATRLPNSASIRAVAD